MEFPLNDYLPELQLVGATIPRDHIIEKQEILNLSLDVIEAVKIVVHYTFPPETSANNYECMNITTKPCINKIISKFKDGTIVLAPGDSPSKLLQIVKYVFYNAESGLCEYEIIDPGTGEISLVQKRLKFIEFPLSSASKWPEVAIEQYLRQVLSGTSIDPTKIIYVDYILGGGTHELLQQALRNIYQMPKFMLPSFNIEPECFDTSSPGCRNMDMYFMHIFSDTEETGCRCQPSFPFRPSNLYPGPSNYNLYSGPNNLYQAPGMINMQRCNLILILMYLRALDAIGSSPQLDLIEDKDVSIILPPDEFYRIKFYDLAIAEIRTAIVYVSKISEMLLYYEVEGQIEDETLFSPISIRASSLMEAEPLHFPNTIPRQRIAHQPMGTIGTITLVNGRQLIARWGAFGFETAEWTPENARQNRPKGIVLMNVIASFTPTSFPSPFPSQNITPSF